jgi:hypothetical protein
VHAAPMLRSKAAKAKQKPAQKPTQKIVDA